MSKLVTGIFVSVCFILFFLTGLSCKRVVKEFVPSIVNPDSVPVMRTDSIITLISDSGRIRYRIITAVWEVYDKVKKPYWFFPEKIHLERFDDSLHVESVIECDTARYFTRLKLWELKNHVYIVNLEGESFETSSLFWDEFRGRVYSDSFIQIEKKNVVLSGIGFESNQSMTKYSIFEPNGPIYLDSDQP